MGGLCVATKKVGGGLYYTTANQKDLWDGDLAIIYFGGNANTEKFYWRRRRNKKRKFQLQTGDYILLSIVILRGDVTLSYSK